MFHRRANRKPLKPPMNSDGAKVPPQPPAPLVAEVAKTLVTTTKATYSTSNLPLPAKSEFCMMRFQSLSPLPSMRSDRLS